MDLARCGRIGSLQDGLITRNQALTVLAPHQIDHLMQAGTWQSVHRSVYRIAGAPITWNQRARAATLTGAVASYLTAARLWGLIEFEPRRIEATVAYGRSRRLAGVDIHISRYLHSKAITQCHGIKVTTVARTLIDMTAVCSPKVLQKAVDQAITQRLVTLDAIEHELKRIGTQGRKRCSMLFEVLALRDEMSEKTRSPSEIDVLGWLKAAKLPLPVPQFPLMLRGTQRYVDFAYPDRGIVIEVQSWRWHGGPGKFEEDIQRKIDIRNLGLSLIELSAKTSRSEVVAVIRRVLDLSNVA